MVLVNTLVRRHEIKTSAIGIRHTILEFSQHIFSIEEIVPKMTVKV